MLFNSSAHPLCTGHAIKITLSTSIPTTLETYYSVTLNCMNRYESAQQHGLTLSCRQGVLVTGVQMPRCTLGSWRQSLSWGADKWASMGTSSNAANFCTNSLCNSDLSCSLYFSVALCQFEKPAFTKGLSFLNLSLGMTCFSDSFRASKTQNMISLFHIMQLLPSSKPSWCHRTGECFITTMPCRNSETGCWLGGLV